MLKVLREKCSIVSWAHGSRILLMGFRRRSGWLSRWEMRKVKGQRITAEGEINGGHLLELNTESEDIHIDKR